MTSEKLTAAAYIQHHLTHWQLSLVPGNAFWTLNLDTMLVSVVLGVLFCAGFYVVARKPVAGVPGGWQNFIEMMIDWVDTSVRETYHGKSTLIAPLALTIFMWVFLMNFMDLIPVDFLPVMMSWFGVEHFKAVPTADLDMTFALSIGVFILILYYNFKIKGPGKVLKETLVSPLGPWLFPINILFRLIDEFVKPLSLSLRLFGNMFAGELIFVLISLMSPWVQWPVALGWAIFHVLIISIQSLIFMMLTIIYLSMAHEAH